MYCGLSQVPAIVQRPGTVASHPVGTGLLGRCTEQLEAPLAVERESIEVGHAVHRQSVHAREFGRGPGRDHGEIVARSARWRAVSRCSAALVIEIGSVSQTDDGAEPDEHGAEPEDGDTERGVHDPADHIRDDWSLAWRSRGRRVEIDSTTDTTSPANAAPVSTHGGGRGPLCARHPPGRRVARAVVRACIRSRWRPSARSAGVRPSDPRHDALTAAEASPSQT